MVDRFPPVRRKVPITSGQVKMQQDCHLLLRNNKRSQVENGKDSHQALQIESDIVTIV
jgi:hypothetical protein